MPVHLFHILPRSALWAIRASPNLPACLRGCVPPCLRAFRAGSESVMQAYTGGVDGALGVQEFAQLIAVLEAQGEAAKRAGEGSTSSSDVAYKIGDTAYKSLDSFAKSLVNIDKELSGR